MSKKIISLLISILFVVSVFVIVPGATETVSETVDILSETETVSETVDILSETETDSEYSLSDYQYGKYFTFFERVITNNDIESEDSILMPVSSLTSVNSYASKDFTTLFSWASDGSARIEKLRLKGWFLTDGGVRKYVVRIVGQDGETSECDVYNYIEETTISDGVNKKAQDEGLIDYAHNAHYDIDVGLANHTNETITVSVWAYTHKGEILQVLELNTVPVSSSIPWNCRWCNYTFTMGIYETYYKSHDNCRKVASCQNCKKATFFIEEHCWSNETNSNGNYYCLNCTYEGSQDCEKENVSYTHIDNLCIESYNCSVCGVVNTVFEDVIECFQGDCPDNDSSHCYYYKEYCLHCGATIIDECTLHGYKDGICFLCGAVKDEEDTSESCEHNYVHSFEKIGTFDICHYDVSVCSKCGNEIREIIPHRIEDGVCYMCNYNFADGCSHDYIHSRIEHIRSEEVCAYDISVCSKCSKESRQSIPHIIENGICKICNYNFADNCLHNYVYSHFEIVGSETICAYNVSVCDKCFKEMRIEINDHKLDENDHCVMCHYGCKHTFVLVKSTKVDNDYNVCYIDEYKCSICSEISVSEIAHTYVDGKCTNCDHKSVIAYIDDMDPKYVAIGAMGLIMVFFLLIILVIPNRRRR